MTLLFNLIAAAHARGTHHRLALDGIARLTGDAAEQWQRLFLSHAADLVAGAKAPDDEFKDFQNHVLHPRDGFWGGAPHKARAWYAEVVESLARRDWKAATWSAGVLSHYVTDPVCPLHTAQSEAENAIHRAFEWSVSRSYADLKRIAAADAARTVNVPEGSDWLEHLLCDAASEANQHYETLIAHYDIQRGVVDPPSGLDTVAQRIVGELLGLASALFAAVLDRAIAEAKVAPPDVSLTAATILATLRIPLNKLLAKLEDRQERSVVEAIYDELQATGKVVVTLPEDDRVVAEAHAREVVASRKAAPRPAFSAAGRTKPAETDRERSERLKRVGSRAMPSPGLARAPGPVASGDGGRETPLDEPPRPAPAAIDQARQAPAVSRFMGDPIVAAPPAEMAHAPSTAAPSPAASGPAASSRTYLSPDHDVVDAPTIGPKMAERLAPLGVRTVGDLLIADPARIAGGLGRSEVDAETVRAWQDQARLVCLVPGLRGTHAQLLVGAGFATAAAIATAEADELCARVLAFAASPAGQRVLRNGEPPDVARIKSWLDGAREVQAEAA